MSNKTVHQRSMGLNAILSSIRTLSTIIFPLITYPYITKTLSVTNIGKINFSQSIISYFTLIAQFGISMFAIRTGARIRDDRVAFNHFANRIFSINLISTLVSMVLLLILLILPTKLLEYRNFICVLSINVALVPISVDWIYTIYEDFGYITLRGILIDLLSLILMLTLVKSNSDAYLYVALITVSTSLGNLFNFFHVHKYVHLKITRHTHWHEYKNSIFMFFINSVTTVIYLNSDVTLLGLMSTNRQVALYSVATKIYSIAKQMFNAIISTTIPRLAYIQQKNQTEFVVLLKRILNIMTFFIVPMIAGLVLIRKNMILIISNSKYIDATQSLSILSFALFFAVTANIVANGLLVILNQEKYVVIGTTASAAINIILNFGLIPLWGQNGAALTTLIAEATMLGISMWAAKSYLKDLLDIPELLKTIVGSVIMFFVTSLMIPFLSTNVILNLIEIVMIAVLIYSISMFLIRDKILKMIINLVKEKLARN
ncbi:MAG: oligosaccharide flippase family protein [Lactobacillus amylovorus]|nr:oligosaccharide flippase family protein [Lactobacillus amylovorus]